MKRAPILTLALACAACGGSSGSESTVLVSGGTDGQRALAEQIGQRMAPSGVNSVVFRPAPTGPYKRWRGERMDVSATGTNVKAGWEANLFAAVFGVEAERKRLHPLGFVTTTGSGGGMFRPDVVSAPRTSPAEVALRRYERRWQTRVASSQAHLVALHEYRPSPDAVALAITVRTEQPAHFLKTNRNWFEFLGTRAPQHTFGVYVALEDSSGTAVWEYSTLPSGGGLRVDPSLAPCSRLLRESPHPINHTYPPCRA